MKKTRGKKSRGTVPLRNFLHAHPNSVSNFTPRKLIYAFNKESSLSRVDERRPDRNAFDSTVPGPNPTSPQTMAKSSSPLVGCQLEWHSSVGGSEGQK
jgi:hypothetical protein